MVASPSDRDGAGDAHVARRTHPEVEHLAHDRGGVDRRVGVGHGDDRAVPAERGGAGRGLDRLRLLASGLAQVGMQVDESWSDDAPARIEHVLALEVLADAGHGTVADQHVGTPAASGVDHGAALDDQFFHVRPAPSSRKSTAMRTATPLAT